MKALLMIVMLSGFSLSALAVDPIVDIHFAAEAIKSIDTFKLSDSDQAKLTWALERLNFATNNLNQGYREGQANSAEAYTTCVAGLSNHTHLNGSDAAAFCERNSSPAFVACVIKLDQTSMPTGDAANACLRHSN